MRHKHRLMLLDSCDWGLAITPRSVTMEMLVLERVHSETQGKKYYKCCFPGTKSFALPIQSRIGVP